MASNLARNPWDLTPVYDLIQSLSLQDSHDLPLHENKPLSQRLVSAGESDSPTKDDTDDHDKGRLGCLKKIWHYLDVPADAPSASDQPFGASITHPLESYNAYASDGVLYYPPSSKSELHSNTDNHDLTDSPDGQLGIAQLTRNQRKKQNRKLRKTEDAAKSEDNFGNGTSNSTWVPHHHVFTNAQAKFDKVNPTATKSLGMKQIEDHMNGNGPAEDGLSSDAALVASCLADVVKITPNLSKLKLSQESSKSLVPKRKAAPTATKPPPNVATPLARVPHPLPDRVAFSTPRSLHERPKKPWQAQNSAETPRKLSTWESVYYTPNKETNQDQAQSVEPPPFPAVQLPPKPSSRHEILPLVQRTSVDRNWALLLKLLQNFPEDKKYLVSPLQLSINLPRPDGIHVFVDASNIQIGFSDQLKATRGIPTYKRVTQIDLNFYALALLLERRRPVAKRVLAGSTPEVKAFEEARQVGYETCILDKVWKTRELSEKQKRYQSNGYASGNESAGYLSSTPAPRWVEQGVDEILHLKILESIVDTPIPAAPAAAERSSLAETPSRPTMVLATGDAAEAEYSPGFLKMVERALRSGWFVELMAFRKSIGMDYRRMSRLSIEKGGWGERFKIIELDEYAEELFGEAM